MTSKSEGGRESRPGPAREKVEKTAGVAAGGSAGTAPRGTSQASGPASEERAAVRGDHDVRTRVERYLVAAAMPLDMRGLVGQLEQNPAIDIIRTVQAGARENVHWEPGERAGWPRTPEFPPILVVATTAEQASLLASSPQLVVEPDWELTYGAPRSGALSPSWYAPPVGVLPFGQTVTVFFHVTDETGRALPHALVRVDGPLAASALTGGDGKARIELPVGTLEAVAAVHIRPHDGCWSTVRVRPRLQLTGENPIECVRLERTVTVIGVPRDAAGSKDAPAFPERALESWARQALGFERVPPHYLGRGVRIGLIDSGASERHPDLSGRLADGRDVVAGDDKSWLEDQVGSGTHSATLIAGTDDGTGVVGLAPEAELHVCKVFPDGHVSDLIEALDYCIEQQLDIAQISLVTAEPSTLLAAKIEQARASGVLCVAAVGDSGGPVGFPAALPTVLSVGAVGRLGTYPPDSCHAEQVHGLPSPEGYFGAATSNVGPGIDLCAPGVAVVGGLPPAAYGPLDGTAVASAHISALAALTLAHHPDFHSSFRVRGPQRVDHLRSLILASCRPLPSFAGGGPYPWWTPFGAGLPDAAVAVGVVPPLAPQAVWPRVLGSVAF